MSALRGWARLTPEQRRANSSRAGKAAAAKGTGHRFSPEQARAAGKKGGATTGRDRAHMAAIGRLGGLAGRRVPVPDA